MVCNFFLIFWLIVYKPRKVLILSVSKQNPNFFFNLDFFLFKTFHLVWLLIFVLIFGWEWIVYFISYFFGNFDFSREQKKKRKKEKKWVLHFVLWKWKSEVLREPETGSLVSRELWFNCINAYCFAILVLRIVFFLYKNLCKISILR